MYVEYENMAIIEKAILNDFNQVLREAFGGDEQALRDFFLHPEHSFSEEEVADIVQVPINLADEPPIDEDYIAAESAAGSGDVGAFYTIETTDGDDATVGLDNGISCDDIGSETSADAEGIRYECFRCRKPYKTHQNLRKHMKSSCRRRPRRALVTKGKNVRRKLLLPGAVIHSSGGQFACDKCERAFASQVSLKNHERVHKIGGRSKCPRCNREFTYVKNLKKHSRLHCDICVIPK